MGEGAAPGICKRLRTVSGVLIILISGRLLTDTPGGLSPNILAFVIAEEIDAVLTEYENQYYEMLAEGESLEEAEYQGRKVTLNKPMRGDVKKSKVYVKNAKGNVVKVNFGDKKMKIKKSNPKRRKSFRARHNCKNPGPKWKARYWSCKAW